jgi:hypothetical protein
VTLVALAEMMSTSIQASDAPAAPRAARRGRTVGIVVGAAVVLAAETAAARRRPSIEA